MTSIVTHNIPNSWDRAFFSKLVPSRSSGWDKGETETVLRFTGVSLESVIAAHEEYKTAYLPTLQSVAIKEIARIRKEKVKTVTFGPMALEVDYITESRVTGAVVFLQLAPDVTEVNWDMGEGNFITMSRETVFALGYTLGAHVQGVFNRAKVLTDAVNAAATTDDLVFGELESGWPA